MQNKTNYACINKKKRKPFISCQSSGAEISFFYLRISLFLDLARDVDVPAIAYQKPETDTFLHADMVVEGFEEVDMTFLQRVYRDISTFHGRFWRRNAVIVRELELSDLDDLFSMYAEPGMTDYMEGL